MADIEVTINYVERFHFTGAIDRYDTGPNPGLQGFATYDEAVQAAASRAPQAFQITKSYVRRDLIADQA